MVDFGKLVSIKGNIPYSTWLERCRNVMLYRTGLSLDDFPFPYIHNYDAYMSPRQTVDACIEREGLTVIDGDEQP